MRDLLFVCFLVYIVRYQWGLGGNPQKKAETGPSRVDRRKQLIGEAKFCSAKKRYLIQIETNQRKWRGRRLSPAFARTVRLRHRAVGWHLGCLEVRILSMQCQFCPSLRSIPVPLATQHGASQHLNEELEFEWPLASPASSPARSSCVLCLRLHVAHKL